MCVFDVGKCVLNRGHDEGVESVSDRRRRLTFIPEAPYVVSTNSGEDETVCIFRPSPPLALR